MVPEDNNTELVRAGDEATSKLLAPPVDDGDKLTSFEENDSVNEDELRPAEKDQQMLRTWWKCNSRLRAAAPQGNPRT